MGLAKSAHGYDWAGKYFAPVHTHRCGSRHLLFLFRLQQTQEIIITSEHPFYRRLTE
jgi:hypothetical protein